MFTKEKCLSILLVLVVIFASTSVFAARLPIVGSDNNSWGTLLNQYLNVTLNQNGTLRFNTINNSHISSGSISSDSIATNAINSSHIVDGQITNADISSSAAITVDKIQGISSSHTHSAANITSGTLNATQGGTGLNSFVAGDLLYAVDSTNLSRLGVTNTDRVLISSPSFLPQWGLVFSAMIADQGVNSADINFSAINSSHISNGSILSGDLSVGSVGSFQLLDGSITNNDIASNASIAISKLQSGLDDTHTHNAGNITSGFFNATQGGTGRNSYTVGDILYAATSTTLTVLGVNNTERALVINPSASVPGWGQIISAMIALQAINPRNINVSAVNTTHILDGTLSGVDIAGDSINSTHIVDNSITSADILDRSITADEIDNTTNLTVNTINATNLQVPFETVTDSCNSGSCTATATCSAGKRVIFGYTAQNSLLCTTSPATCTAFCTPGLSSCSITATISSASVYAVCI